ncbi:SigE family RNA polymerase sigma factor [Actinopolymorpha pittospori]|uniref:RNA polymerase sigma-70 factor (Sigma-E family) n=1 Tax=Actinopolymorpha pittospori TaxID=648752 RepID=A0A927N990_9ACTN|nr:RNA polymerase sigma-70 factor (sigma-E family) [Actinopolymorpha pittospori]
MADTAEEFSSYVAARHGALTRTAFLLTGDHHAAEDLVQTALARTYLAWSRIHNQTALDTYVRRTMVNEHTSWWRRAWRRGEALTAELPDHPATDPRADPDGLAERDGDLWRLLRALPAHHRAAVVLRYFEDLSEAETAEILGCSIGTVKSRTHRALATLRAGLTPPTEPAAVPDTEPVRRDAR